MARGSSWGPPRTIRTNLKIKKKRLSKIDRAVLNAPKFSHTTPILQSLHWLKINERIEYKLLSLTYKIFTNHSNSIGRLLVYCVLTTAQPFYLYLSIHNLIFVQALSRTRSSSIITITWPSSSSSLKITDRSFWYASSYLWNKLAASLMSISVSRILTILVTLPIPLTHRSILAPPPLSPYITPILFHSKLKVHLFQKSFPP